MLDHLYETIKSSGAAAAGALSRDALEPHMTVPKRERLESLLPSWRTVIIIAYPYYVNHIADDANIARYAWGQDYHRVTTDALAPAVAYLEERGIHTRALVDSSPIPEKLAAALAGLGFLGRHSLLICPDYGSYVFLGSIVCDVDFELPPPREITRCEICGECVRACPMSALDDGFNRQKCLSDMTQKRGNLTNDEKDAVRRVGYVWGCDICQDVCPHNKNARETDIPGLREELLCKLDLREVEGMSDREFREAYGNRAFAWRGREVILRNLRIMRG